MANMMIDLEITVERIARHHLETCADQALADMYERRRREHLSDIAGMLSAPAENLSGVIAAPAGDVLALLSADTSEARLHLDLSRARSSAGWGAW